MKDVTAGNFGRLPDDKYKECESIPHLKLLDKPAKKKRRRKEAKEACLAISFVWLLGMALMSQAVIENDAIADAYSIMLVITAVLQAAGCR